MQAKDFNYLNVNTAKITQIISPQVPLTWQVNGILQPFCDTAIIDEKIYLDPDTYSYELYQSLYEQYQGKKLKSGNRLLLTLANRTIKAAVINPQADVLFTTVLTSDYIGPSKNWANAKRRRQSPKCTQGEISHFLWEARKLGGHILLPKSITISGQGILSGTTINQRRGGAGGLYDRFDLFLLDIKNWYEHRESHLLTSFTVYRLWLEQFVDFAGFIEFYQLMAFVEIENNTYKIKNLWPHSTCPQTYFDTELTNTLRDIPTTHDEYIKYADNAIKLIGLRNAAIFS